MRERSYSLFLNGTNAEAAFCWSATIGAKMCGIRELKTTIETLFCHRCSPHLFFAIDSDAILGCSPSHAHSPTPVLFAWAFSPREERRHISLLHHSNAVHFYTVIPRSLRCLRVCICPFSDSTALPPSWRYGRTMSSQTLACSRLSGDQSRSVHLECGQCSALAPLLEDPSATFRNHHHQGAETGVPSCRIVISQRTSAGRRRSRSA